MSKPLSPQAQAVLDAFGNATGSYAWVLADEHRGIAAALRAVADQVVPNDYDPPRTSIYPEAQAFVDGKECRNESVRYELLAIAAELEGAA
jgi:hypothetical protein